MLAATAAAPKCASVATAADCEWSTLLLLDAFETTSLRLTPLMDDTPPTPLTPTGGVSVVAVVVVELKLFTLLLLPSKAPCGGDFCCIDDCCDGDCEGPFFSVTAASEIRYHKHAEHQMNTTNNTYISSRCCKYHIHRRNLLPH